MTRWFPEAALNRGSTDFCRSTRQRNEPCLRATPLLPRSSHSTFSSMSRSGSLKRPTREGTDVWSFPSASLWLEQPDSAQKCAATACPSTALR